MDFLSSSCVCLCVPCFVRLLWSCDCVEAATVRLLKVVLRSCKRAFTADCVWSCWISKIQLNLAGTLTKWFRSRKKDHEGQDESAEIVNKEDSVEWSTSLWSRTRRLKKFCWETEWRKARFKVFDCWNASFSERKTTSTILKKEFWVGYWRNFATECLKWDSILGSENLTFSGSAAKSFWVLIFDSLNQ